ncbi:MAG: hypothetical protein EX254_10430 [Flavobacteriaceae bacterium]|nr:MAG: hypothetical protein EX254_10430 [Flavobacteriaceae bacterium]
MKNTTLLLTLLLLIPLHVSSQSIIELKPSQSMSIIGKGPGQDAAINPYADTDSKAVIENIGKNPFTIRIQDKKDYMKLISVGSGETKEIDLIRGYEIYFDSESDAKANIEFKPLSMSDRAITPEDLKTILGDWTGSLTYIDYGSGKPYTMPADLIVEKGKSENQLILSNIYPNEPKANGKSKISISKDGMKLNKKDLKSKQVLPDGQIKIITEYSGKDNRKNALIRNIYILGEKEFIIRKEVQFEDSTEWLKRNEYSYTRRD